jgi:transposase
MPKKIEPAVRERVMRMVAEHRSEYATPTALARVIAARERLGVETVRRWIVQAEVDGGIRPGLSSTEHAEIKALKAQVRQLEEDNAILKAATVFFVGNSTPATADHGFHRRHESRRLRSRVDLPGAA